MQKNVETMTVPKFEIGEKVLITSNSQTWEDEIVRLDEGRYFFKSGGHLSFDRQKEQLKKISRPELKIGDWVKSYYYNANEEECFKVLKVKYVDEEVIEYFDTTLYQYFSNNPKIELWEPKIGEWCWFISVHDTFELMKFAGMLSEKRYQAETIHGGIYNYSRCEPFVGKLPTYIQENEHNKRQQ